MMTALSLLFFFFYSILISCMTFLTLVWMIYHQKQSQLTELIHSFSLKMEVAEQGIEGEVDKRLNAVIAGFKAKMPMISMFLSKSKEAELKEVAKTELMKLVPALKEHFFINISDIDHDQKSFEVQLSCLADQLIDRLWKQVQSLLFFTALGVGFFLGALEMLLVYCLF